MRLVRTGIVQLQRRTIARVKRLFAVRNLIVAAVLLLVSFTAYHQLKIRREQLTRAEVDRLSKAGIAALQAGEIQDADEHFSQAVAWMTRTKQVDTDWDITRHIAAETNSACRMLQEPLDATLTFVAGDLNGRQRLIAGKGLMLDVVVTSTDDGGWTCDFVAFVNDETVAVRFPRESLYSDASFSVPTRVILLARIESLTKDEQGWVLKFSPQSVVLMTQPTLLSYLNMADKESQDLVMQQARIFHTSDAE